MSDIVCTNRFQGHGVIIDALDILCAQVTCSPFPIAKFLSLFGFCRVFDLSVHMSICLSHPGIESELINIGSCGFHC